MKKTILLSLLASAGLCSATTLNLTGFNNNTFPPIITGFDFGNGITADITVTDANNIMGVGLGSTLNGGNNNQLEDDETISFTFSNIQAGEGNTAVINLLGLVSDAEIPTDDQLFIFGNSNSDQAIAASTDGSSATISSDNTSELEGSLADGSPVLLNEVDTPVTLGEGDTLSITPGNGDAFRIQGIELTAVAVPVPEPTSVTLLGIGGLALLARRKRS